jgi:protein-tyrosine phosphatase
MAEAILNYHLGINKLEDSVKVDSAGLIHYHANYPPDHRTIQVCVEKNTPIDHLARQIQDIDFIRYDFILAMDKDNMLSLKKLAPDNAKAKMMLIRDFSHGIHIGKHEVPDPFTGDITHFREVFTMLNDSCMGFIDYLKSHKLV